MKRAVITGMGLVSPLGNNLAETLNALKEMQSGIRLQEEYQERGLRSHVAGSIHIDIKSALTVNCADLWVMQRPIRTSLWLKL